MADRTVIDDDSFGTNRRGPRSGLCSPFGLDPLELADLRSPPLRRCRRSRTRGRSPVPRTTTRRTTIITTIITTAITTAITSISPRPRTAASVGSA
jgi:hypothetical protein